jgi:Dynein heavy chain AAA lid domain
MSVVQAHFLFALVWSLGANTDAAGRATFDSLLRQLITGQAPAELSAYVTAPPVRPREMGSRSEYVCAPMVVCNHAMHHYC